MRLSERVKKMEDRCPRITWADKMLAAELRSRQFFYALACHTAEELGIPMPFEKPPEPDTEALAVMDAEDAAASISAARAERTRGQTSWIFQATPEERWERCRYVLERPVPTFASARRSEL